MEEVTARATFALKGGSPTRLAAFPKWPVFGYEEERELLEVFRGGKWWYGEKVKRFEEAFARFHDARYGVTCCNGTVALELALRALGIAAGDEVLVPAYTFIATATTVLTANAKPVFVDVEENTFNMDLNHAESLITDRTRAMIIVHFAGLPMDMDRVAAFAEKHHLRVIEDAAHAWGSQWKGKGVGALAAMGTFSFQMSKNITAGEGGIVISNDKDYADLVRSYSNCGRVVGGEWYDHINVGGNYRITEFQAAILLCQLARLESQILKRERNAAYLNERLSQIPGIRLSQQDPRVTRRSHHLYMFRYLQEEFGNIGRGQFLEALNAEGIPAIAGYLTPVYGNRCFQKLTRVPGLERCPEECPCNGAFVDYKSVHCPVAERLCGEEAVWLPHYVLLGEQSDMDSIAQAIEKVYTHRNELF